MTKILSLILIVFLMSCAPVTQNVVKEDVKVKTKRIEINDNSGKNFMNFYLFYDEKDNPAGMIITDSDSKVFLKKVRK